MEALIGAIYLDRGLAAAEQSITNWFAGQLNVTLEAPVKDAKTSLQEWLQARGKPLPDYQVVKTEHDHNLLFTVNAKLRAGIRR